MKKEKSCKSHKGESTIGKIIYGFMLFAPLFAILTTCMYVIFNKNAYENYQGTTYRTEETEVNNENFVIGRYYNFKNYTYNTSNNQFIVTFENAENLPDVKNGTILITGVYRNKIDIYIYDYNPTEFYKETNDDSSNFGFLANPNNFKINYRVTYTKTQQILNFTAKITSAKNLKPTENAIKGNPWTPDTNAEEKLINAFELTTYKYYSEDKINYVFYHAIGQTEESNLFNWSKNTLIYTGMQATANTLGITNTFIPMLLSYWLIISTLYFIYDIVLMIILILHDKIHELQESI